MRLRAVVPLGLALALAVPAAAGAATPERRRHHRDRDRCHEDCRRSDDHGGDGERRKCVGLIAMCDVVIIPPTPFTPAPEAQPMAFDPTCIPLPVPAHCDPKPTALFPPKPEKIVELIQAFSAGVAKSAGDLAGAIAAFPPALLL